MQPTREVIDVRDQDGNLAKIIRVTPYRHTQSLDGSSWIPELPSLFTQTGERINPLPDGSFQEVRYPERRYWPE